MKRGKRVIKSRRGQGLLQMVHYHLMLIVHSPFSDNKLFCLFLDCITTSYTRLIYALRKIQSNAKRNKIGKVNSGL